MSSTDHKSSIKKVSWAQAREKVQAISPELARIIDEISPPDNLHLYIGKYSYGSSCMKNGQFYIPLEDGTLKPISDSSVPSHIQADLGYNLNSNPVSLTLRNSFELFLALPDRTIPFYGMIPAGKILGTWRILTPQSNHPRFLWGMTAGARSIFMLPKITEAASHEKLVKVLGVSQDAPRTLLDHWEIFRQIYNHYEKSSAWFSEMLYFPQAWIEKKDDPAFFKLHHYFLNAAWTGSEYYRNQYIWNLIFSLIQERYKIKPTAYIADTVKHLFGILAGGTPGFAPATDESAAPIKLLQEAYVNVYRLKKYHPVIMQPALYSYLDKKPVYYSLNFPTALEFAQKSNKKNSAISDLFSVKSLLEKYRYAMLNDGFEVGQTRLVQNLQNANFRFLHGSASEYNIIDSNEVIPTLDARFNTSFLNDTTEKNFPRKSTFISAAVSIGEI